MKPAAAAVLFAATALVPSVLPAVAAAQHAHGAMPHHSDPTAEERPRTPPEPLPARTIEIRVTEKGFEPDRIVAKKGERIRLVVKRTTDATCVKDLVMDEFLIWNHLPLNEPFTTTFTIGRRGDFVYTCPSGAVRGTLTVEDDPRAPDR